MFLNPNGPAQTSIDCLQSCDRGGAVRTATILNLGRMYAELLCGLRRFDRRRSLNCCWSRRLSCFCLGGFFAALLLDRGLKSAGLSLCERELTFNIGTEYGTYRHKQEEHPYSVTRSSIVLFFGQRRLFLPSNIQFRFCFRA